MTTVFGCILRNKYRDTSVAVSGAEGPNLWLSGTIQTQRMRLESCHPPTQFPAGPLITSRESRLLKLQTTGRASNIIALLDVLLRNLISVGGVLRTITIRYPDFEPPPTQVHSIVRALLCLSIFSAAIRHVFPDPLSALPVPPVLQPGAPISRSNSSNAAPAQDLLRCPRPPSASQ